MHWRVVAKEDCERGSDQRDEAAGVDSDFGLQTSGLNNFKLPLCSGKIREFGYSVSCHIRRAIASISSF